MPPRLQVYPRPPVELSEPLVVALLGSARSYFATSRLAAIAWRAHPTGYRVPDADLGFWPLFWLAPVLDHRGEVVERLF